MASVCRVLCLTHTVSLWGPERTSSYNTDVCSVHCTPRTRRVPRLHRSPGRLISREGQSKGKNLSPAWEGACILGNMKIILASQNSLACLTALQGWKRTQSTSMRCPPIFHAGSGQPYRFTSVECAGTPILISHTERRPTTSAQLRSGTCTHRCVERRAAAQEQP